MPQLADASWPITTERLVIRPATAADAEQAFAYRQHPQVTEYTTAAATDRETFVTRFCSDERLAELVVVERDGEVIGDLMVQIKDSWSQAEVTDQAAGTQAELGWTFNPAHTGHGYATETVTALIDMCFTQLGLRRVEAGCFAANERSWRLMERVGMRREGYYIGESLHRDGTWHDAMSYALLAHEWAERRPA